MSGLAAAVRFSGGPEPREPLARLVGMMEERAPDGWTSWTAAGAGLARLHRLVFQHQQASGQPACEVAGPHVLVFDGRLDNREALARIDPLLTPASDDAAYALAAVARYGAAAAEQLEGDFAFIAWNGATRTLIAARDPLGMRPLYWAEIDGLWCAASAIAPLVGLSRDRPRPDTGAIARFLHFEPPTGATTLFQGIQRVPPGHTLVARDGRVRLLEYWRAEAAPADDRRDDASYAAECGVLLGRATRARLRASTPAVVFFSGGIDSSSVLAAAVEAARDHPALMPHVVSARFTQPEAEEQRYRDAFVDAYGTTIEYVRPAQVSEADFTEPPRGTRVLPDLPGEIVGRPLFEAAHRLGARVALTGGGGDFLFGGSTLHYADLLRRGRVGEALRQYRDDRLTDDSGWSRSGLLTDGIWPMLPQPVRELLRRPGRFLIGRDEGAPWVRLPVASRPAVPDPPPGVSHASWEICWGMRNGWTSYFLEATERSIVRFALESRHPLFDPAVVRFALSLPERQRRRGRITKFVLRHAVPLPALIRGRLTKADQGFGLSEALAAIGGRRLFERLQIADEGWVDPAALIRSYDRALTHPALVDPHAAALLPRLWITAAVELWYRAVYGAGIPAHEGACA